MLTGCVHRLLGSPWAYDLLQRAVGGRRLQRRLAAHAAALPRVGWVLDLGGGTGTFGDLLDATARYVCLDVDAARLRGFRRRHLTGYAVLGNAALIPVASGAVDVVLCAAVSHHLNDAQLEAMVSEGRRVLSRRGRLLFMDAVWVARRPTSRVLWRLDQGSHPRTAGALRAALERAFDIVAWDQLAILHEYVIAVGVPRSAGAGVRRDAT